MNNTKWTLLAIGYMCGFAYGLALIVYPLGGLLLGMVSFNFFTVIAFVLLGILLHLFIQKGI